MRFTLERFCEVRPFLYHLTAQGNLNRILATRTLQPARELMEIGGWTVPRTHPRRHHQVVEVDGQVVWVRDQKPLHAGNIAFEDAWDMPSLLAHIDSHVFFWPGREDGPVEAGRNHFKTYQDECPALLRMPTGSLLAVNSLSPLFCRFNSGSPRTTNGRKSPRGSRTYVAHDTFEGTPGDVKEVVFAGAVRLPNELRLATDYRGPWRGWA